MTVWGEEVEASIQPVDLSGAVKAVLLNILSWTVLILSIIALLSMPN